MPAQQSPLRGLPPVGTAFATCTGRPSATAHKASSRTPAVGLSRAAWEDL